MLRGDASFFRSETPFLEKGNFPGKTRFVVGLPYYETVETAGAVPKADAVFAAAAVVAALASFGHTEGCMWLLPSKRHGLVPFPPVAAGRGLSDSVEGSFVSDTHETCDRNHYSCNKQ